MSKGQIYFSNRIEELIPFLKEELYPKQASVFDKRLLILPNLEWKGYLMQELAKDSQLQIAAGLCVTNLAQAYTKLTKKRFPEKIELSLFLQHEMSSLIEEEEELALYFTQEVRERRLGPFCDILAFCFLRYAIFGKEPLPAWQEKLWKKWDFEKTTLHAIPWTTSWNIHLFGFSFIPKFYFDFFKELQASMYIFSPCSIFWGDFYSNKERSFLRKKISKNQIFDERIFSLDEQNPFLANWGIVGRKMHLAIEDSHVQTIEHYVIPEKKSCLEALQKDLLFGTVSKISADDSIGFVSAFSLYREVEMCKDQILHLCTTKKIEPKEIQIFAPDITPYVPYIHAIFSDIAYSISDIPMQEENPLAKAFFKLLKLPEKRFAAKEVLQLFPYLTQSHFDLDLMKKWIEKGHIHFGATEETKKLLYLKDYKEEQMYTSSSIGTWKHGYNQLLWGIGHSEGIQGVGPEEMLQFDTFYQTFQSIEEDLAPLYDGTCWTIPTWLRYCACLLESYFSIDASYDLYKELMQLADICISLNKETYTFRGIERILQFLLIKKTCNHKPPHLQAVHFGSLMEGCFHPTKAIFLLGMQEETFPRKEEISSLCHATKDFCPNSIEKDRFLFLEALCYARKFLYMSYIRDAEGKKGPSFLIKELLTAIEGAIIESHPATSYDLAYFGGKYFSYNKIAYQVAKTQTTQIGKNSFTPPPLIPEFYQSTCLSLMPLESVELNVQKLCKFAKHPLRYYFHEILKIFPEFEQDRDQEYLLHPLTKHKLVRKALQKPLEQVLEEAKEELPVHLLRPFAIWQIKQEVEEWHEALKTFNILPQELETKRILTQIGPILIHGNLEFFTKKGLLVKGKNRLEDWIKFWPQALLMKQLGLPLLFSKDQTLFTPEGDPEKNLELYLSYFQLAQKHPSPLVPSVVKDLHKELKQMEDEIFSYLYFRDPVPNFSIIEKNWKALMHQVFGGIFCNRLIS